MTPYSYKYWWIELSLVVDMLVGNGGNIYLIVTELIVMGFNLRTLSAYESHLFGQVECHPYFPQVELFNFCQERGVVFSAYSPLGCGDRAWKLEGEPDIFDDPKIQKIAQRLGKSVAQVAIRYACKLLKSLETQVCLLSLIIFSSSFHHHYKACLFLFKLIPHNHIHFGYVMMGSTL